MVTFYPHSLPTICTKWNRFTFATFSCHTWLIIDLWNQRFRGLFQFHGNQNDLKQKKIDDNLLLLSLFVCICNLKINVAMPLDHFIYLIFGAKLNNRFAKIQFCIDVSHCVDSPTTTKNTIHSTKFKTNKKSP